jgi:predicted nucleic acid-binding Zn ribbon protein
VPDEPLPGEPGGDGPERARRAADALAVAKADARARSERAPARDFDAKRISRGDPAAPARRPPGPGKPAGAGEAGGAGGVGGAGGNSRARGAGRSGRARRDDPQPLRAAIDGLIDDQGWRTAAAVGSVFGRWEQIVGDALAAHTRPGGFTDGELLVIADSTAWATQVRLLRAQLVRRLNSELGDGTVTGVKVRGPVPPRQRGQWRVRDTRGPRDDYG